MSSVDELESLSASDVFGITEEDIHELRAHAQECIDQRLHEEAQDTLLTLISVCPDDELITIVYAELMIELGDSEEAETQLSEFLDSHPDNLNALVSLAHARVAGVQPEGLGELLDRILTIDPDFHLDVSDRAQFVVHKAYQMGFHFGPVQEPKLLAGAPCRLALPPPEHYEGDYDTPFNTSYMETAPPEDNLKSFIASNPGLCRAIWVGAKLIHSVFRLVFFPLRAFAR